MTAEFMTALSSWKYYRLHLLLEQMLGFIQTEKSFEKTSFQFQVFHTQTKTCMDKALHHTFSHFQAYHSNNKTNIQLISTGQMLLLFIQTQRFWAFYILKLHHSHLLTFSSICVCYQHAQQRLCSSMLALICITSHNIVRRYIICIMNTKLYNNKKKIKKNT